MEKAVSAADANRNFSQLLRGVRRGLSYVVTSHGHAVARLSAVEAAEPSAGAGARGLVEAAGAAAREEDRALDAR